jgi:trk system potassium uptake protein TrkA
MWRVHVVIVGCGRVGSELAVSLDGSGHSVAIIDRNPASFRKRLPEQWGGSAVVGSGFDRDHLEAAGVQRADALVAVTSGDNTNILAARIARETYDVAYVVARIYDPRRAVIYQRLGIPTVATVSWTTEQIRNKLFPDQVSPNWIDPTGSVVLVERPLPPDWAGRKLADLEETGKFEVVALTRDGEVQLAAAGLLGQEGDVVHLMARKDALDALDASLRGSDAEEAR